MNLNNALNKFGAISIDELDQMKLLKRFDTKFIMPYTHIEALIQGMEEDYRVLEIDDKRIFTYESLYMDTDQHTFYKQHHNKKLNRYKVRFRNYVDADKHYLEIKHKTNKGKLNKYRKKKESIEKVLSQESKAYIDKKVKNINADDLSQKLWTNYKRFTLANTKALEKITIDTDVTFIKAEENLKEVLPAVVVEIKQSQRSLKSPFMHRLTRDFHIAPTAFSKYCIGMILLHNDVKYNRFKSRLLALERMS